MLTQAKRRLEKDGMNVAGGAFKNFVEMSLDSIKFNKH